MLPHVLQAMRGNVFPVQELRSEPSSRRFRRPGCKDETAQKVNGNHARDDHDRGDLAPHNSIDGLDIERDARLLPILSTDHPARLGHRLADHGRGDAVQQQDGHAADCQLDIAPLREEQPVRRMAAITRLATAICATTIPARTTAIPAHATDRAARDEPGDTELGIRTRCE